MLPAILFGSDKVDIRCTWFARSLSCTLLANFTSLPEALCNRRESRECSCSACAFPFFLFTSFEIFEKDFAIGILVERIGQEPDWCKVCSDLGGRIVF